MANTENYQIFQIFIEVMEIFACDYCRTTEVCNLFDSSAKIFESLANEYNPSAGMDLQTISITEDVLLDFMQFSNHLIEQLKVTYFSIIYCRVKETKRIWRRFNIHTKL